MALTISESGGGNFETIPVGRYKASCYRIVDVGTHNETYEGETKKRHSVFVYWELSEHKMADDKPFSIMKQYTLSLNEKSALYIHLCTWRNKKFTEDELKGFDLTNILGCTCELEVEYTSGGNPKVTAVYHPEGGVQKVATVNSQLAFDVDEYAADNKQMCDVFVELPEWVQNKIDESFECVAANKKESEKFSPAEKEEFSSLDALADSDKSIEEKIPF
mgnify:CR=1 FL=1